MSLSAGGAAPLIKVLKTAATAASNRTRWRVEQKGAPRRSRQTQGTVSGSTCGGEERDACLSSLSFGRSRLDI